MEQPLAGGQSASEALIASQTAFRNDQFKEIITHIERLNPSRDGRLTDAEKRFLLDTSEEANKTSRSLPLSFRREFIRYQHNHKVYGKKQTVFISNFLQDFFKHHMGLALDMAQEDRLLRKCVNFIKNAQYRTYTKPPLCNDGRHTPTTFHEEVMWKVCWDDREQVWKDQDRREKVLRSKSRRKRTSVDKSKIDDVSRIIKLPSHEAQSSTMPPPPLPSKSSKSNLPHILNHPSDSPAREPQSSFSCSSPPQVSTSYSPRIPNHDHAPQTTEPQHLFPNSSPPEVSTSHSQASQSPSTAPNPHQHMSSYQPNPPLPMFHSHTLPRTSANPLMQSTHRISHPPKPYTHIISVEPLPLSNHGFPTWSQEDLDRISIGEDDKAGPAFRDYCLPTPSRDR